MPESNIFGSIFLSPEFDDAIEAFIRKWIDTYLSEIEFRSGIPRRTMTRPRSYLVTNEPEKFPDDSLPLIMIVSSGMSDPPVMNDTMAWDGWWDWVVVIITAQRDEKSTRKMSQRYGAAIRAMVMQRPDLEGAVDDTEFLGESYGYLPQEDRNRSRAVAGLEFRSYIQGIVEQVGPPEPDPAEPENDPDDEPRPDYPTIEQVSLEIVNDPIT